LAPPSRDAYDGLANLNGGWPWRSCRVQAFGSKRRPMRYFAPVVGFLLLSAATVLEPASAQPNRARQGVQSGEVRSLDQILNGIRRERPGSLADVEGPNFGPAGEPHYRLKWLTPDGARVMARYRCAHRQSVGRSGRRSRPPAGCGSGAAWGARTRCSAAQFSRARRRLRFWRPDDQAAARRNAEPPSFADQNFAPGRQQPDLLWAAAGSPAWPTAARLPSKPCAPGFDRGPQRPAIRRRAPRRSNDSMARRIRRAAISEAEVLLGEAAR